MSKTYTMTKDVQGLLTTFTLENKKTTANPSSWMPYENSIHMLRENLEILDAKDKLNNKIVFISYITDKGVVNGNSVIINGEASFDDIDKLMAVPKLNKGLPSGRHNFLLDGKKIYKTKISIFQRPESKQINNNTNAKDDAKVVAVKVGNKKMNFVE